MWCDNCKNSFMTRSIFNQIVLPGWSGVGYSKIVEYKCPECDYNFKKVA